MKKGSEPVRCCILNRLGGFILNYGTLTVNLSSFRNSKASSGGAITNDGTMMVMNSFFENNTAKNRYIGGAIYNQETATIENSTFVNNFAGDGSAVAGAYDSTTTIGNFHVCRKPWPIVDDRRVPYTPLDKATEPISTYITVSL